MLDVHPPHAATHTWRDFFIHIATIVVGLLIAVGLEQTVEAIHHHRVRDELRRALEADEKLDQGIVQQDFAAAASEEDWALKQALAIEHADLAGPLVVELEPTKLLFYTPYTGAWLSAKANGDARLLTPPELECLTDLDRVEADLFLSDSGAFGQLQRGKDRLQKDLLGRHPEEGKRIDLTSMNKEQRAETADAFRSIAAAAHAIRFRLIVYSTYVDFILSYPGGVVNEVGTDMLNKRFEGIYSKNLAQHADSFPPYDAREEH